MKTFHVQLGRDLKVDVLKLIESRVGICANSGAGKSHLMRLLIEQIDGRIPVHIIDWEGEYSTLRSKIDAVYVAKGGDLEPQPGTAHKLAQKLLEKRVSAILDVSSLARIDRLNFIGAYLEGLLDVPAALWTPILVFLDESQRVCLDEETEVLTKNGWRHYTQLEKGMPVVAFDLDTQEYCYEPVQDVLVYEYEGPMVSIETRGVSMLSTPDHRVVLQRTQRAMGRYGKTYGWTFCSAADLPQQFHIPLGGSPCGPGIEGLSPDILRVLGWILTDGYRSGGNLGIGISQSTATVKYGRHMETEIRSLLQKLFPDATDYTRDRTDRPSKILGRVVQNPTPEVCFYIGAKSTRKIEKILGSSLPKKQQRRVPRHLIEECSQEQLSALFQGLLEGDGGSTKFTPGKSVGLADDFQEISLKLGICTKQRLHPEIKTWTLDMSKRTRHHVRVAEAAKYSGKVWDITVPSGAFVVRRHGRAYVTGNCPEVVSRGGGKDLIGAIHRTRAAVIALMDSGRKRSMGGVLASHRLAKVAKDALGEANNVFFGRFAQDTDLKRVGDHLGLDHGQRDALKTFKPGEFLAQGPAIDKPGTTHFRSLMTQTKAPKFGERVGASQPSKTVKKILADLATLPEEVHKEIRDLKDAKTEIARLTRELKVAQRGGKKVIHEEVPFKEALEAAERRGAKKQLKIVEASQKHTQRWLKRFYDELDGFNTHLLGLRIVGAELGKDVDVHIPVTKSGPMKRVETPADADDLIIRGDKWKSPMAVDQARSETISNGKLPFSWKSAPGKMFTVLLQYHPEELTPSRAASLAGINVKSSTYRGAMSKLRSLGFVEGMNVTDEGLVHQHDVEPLPEGDELIEVWRRRLGQGAPRRVCDVLV